MRFIRKLFGFKERKPKPRLFHDYFGLIQYNDDSKDWETVENEIYYGGISGGETGPLDKSVKAIRHKIENIDKYWGVCEKDLRFIAESYDSIPKGMQINELYKIAALCLYSDYWEICFETYDKYKWLYVGMQFEGDTLVSNTIDT
ncbi:hypothetical protein LZP73_17450 [Shewanella sp. AS16]|uniref:hypothetical protein n=1 Tax=Shewanella sp. AS16 TaxID=2907625 RepID=UPI001F19CCD8|nr:hypothetical protein [Shewanella sp. AS16]MCE9687964.1 hypothetical protein [Shewanella sp. AS16]